MRTYGSPGLGLGSRGSVLVVTNLLDFLFVEGLLHDTNSACCLSRLIFIVIALDFMGNRKELAKYLGSRKHLPLLILYHIPVYCPYESLKSVEKRVGHHFDLQRQDQSKSLSARSLNL